MSSLPANQISAICVMHMVQNLLNNFVEDIHKEADKNAQLHDKDDLDFAP